MKEKNNQDTRNNNQTILYANLEITTLNMKVNAL